MYCGEQTGCGCNVRSGEMSELGFLPAVAAGVSIASTAMSLFKGKPQHYSPWGFHVDEYSQHILDAEGQIASLKRQIAQTYGQQPQFPMTPWPPATPGAFSSSTKQAWYDAMRPVVAQYSSQADCVTNNNQVLPGGCYEQTYAAQLKLIEQLKAQLGQAGPAMQMQPLAPGSATIYNPNVPLMQQPGYPAYGPGMGPGGYGTPPFLPTQQYGTSPFFPQSPIPFPQTQAPQYLPPGVTPSISITQPGAPGSSPGSAMFGADMSNWLLIGAGVIGFVLIMSAQRSSPQPARKGK